MRIMNCPGGQESILLFYEDFALFSILCQWFSCWVSIIFCLQIVWFFAPNMIIFWSRYLAHHVNVNIPKEPFLWLFSLERFDFDSWYYLSCNSSSLPVHVSFQISRKVFKIIKWPICYLYSVKFSFSKGQHNFRTELSIFAWDVPIL